MFDDRMTRDTNRELRDVIDLNQRQGNARRCRACGCTDDDCSGCIARTGKPCHWIAADLCSACASGGGSQ